MAWIPFAVLPNKVGLDKEYGNIDTHSNTADAKTKNDVLEDNSGEADSLAELSPKTEKAKK